MLIFFVMFEFLFYCFFVANLSHALLKPSKKYNDDSANGLLCLYLCDIKQQRYLLYTKDRCLFNSSTI